MELEETNIQTLYNNMSGSIICTFSTNLPFKYRVDSSQITLSTDMDQNSLQLLLKNLLNDKINQEELSRLHFEFAIKGELLRGNLKSHIIRYKISTETNLHIEYFIALNTPQQKQRNQQQDWVSSIDRIHTLDTIPYVVSLYNGFISFYSSDNQFLNRHQIQSDPIKIIKTLPTNKVNEHYLISGGLDQIIKIHSFSQKQNNFLVRQAAECITTDSSILSIDISPLMDGMFCSAGGNNKLSIWKIPEDLETEKSVKVNKKKIQLNLPKLKPIATQQIHEDQINAVLWYTNHQIYTGSSDHSLKIIDVETLSEISTFQIRDSIVTSLDAKNQTILSAHEDGYIRLWDKRTNSICQKTFKSHSKYTSCIKYSSSAYIFASGSYDHTVKIWDIRSIFPLETLSTHHDKVFGLLWKDKKEVISIGSDNLVIANSFENQL